MKLQLHPLDTGLGPEGDPARLGPYVDPFGCRPEAAPERLGPAVNPFG